MASIGLIGAAVALPEAANAAGSGEHASASLHGKARADARSTKVIQVAPGSLAVPAGKIPMGARFEITGVTEHAPTSITVNLSTGTTITAELSAREGDTAFYQAKWATGASVTGATATVPTSWAGEFALVAYRFQTGTTGTGASGSGVNSGTGSSVSGVTGETTGTKAGVAGQSAGGATTIGSTLTMGAQAGSGASGFPAGATGQVAPPGQPGPWWPLVGLGIAGLLGALALRTRAADGKAAR